MRRGAWCWRAVCGGRTRFTRQRAAASEPVMAGSRGAASGKAWPSRIAACEVKAPRRPRGTARSVVAGRGVTTSGQPRVADRSVASLAGGDAALWVALGHSGHLTWVGWRSWRQAGAGSTEDERSCCDPQYRLGNTFSRSPIASTFLVGLDANLTAAFT